MKRTSFYALLGITVAGVITISSASNATGPWLAESFTVSSHTPVQRMINNLGNIDTSQAAVEQLVSRGDSVVPQLTVAAQTSTHMATRGWAIHCLSRIESGTATASLESLATDTEEDALVRTWAWAALIDRAGSLREIALISNQTSQFPALARPISLKATELSKQTRDIPSLLSLMTKYPALQTSLASAIMNAPPEALVDAMLTGPNQQIRRQAASYVAARGQQGHYQEYAEVTLSEMQFRRSARKAPWAGGPLYIPSIAWNRADARMLIGELLAWAVYCEQHNQMAEHQQVLNNLRSVGLLRKAGLNVRSYSLDGYLQAWRQAAGRSAFESLLVRVGVEDQPKYQALLNGAR